MRFAERTQDQIDRDIEDLAQRAADREDEVRRLIQDVNDILEELGIEKRVVAGGESEFLDVQGRIANRVDELERASGIIDQTNRTVQSLLFDRQEFLDRIEKLKREEAGE